MYYALKEAAQLLQVKPTTLDRWLRQAEFAPPSLDAPIISSDQLYDLARRHRRLEALSAGNGPLEALIRQVQALNSKVEQLELAVGGRTLVSNRPPRRDGYARALERAVSAAISFMLDAAQQEGAQQEPIVISSFGPEDVFQRVAWLRVRWVAALRAALEAQWDIVHLHAGKLGPASARLIVENLIGLLGAAGNYDPMYIVDTSQVASSAQEYTEYILIPGRGLFMLTLPHDNEPARYDVLSDGDDYECLRDMLETMRGQGEKLLARTPPSAVGFSGELAEADERKGNRCLIMNGLSEAHVPFEIYLERAKVLEAKATAESDFSESIRLPRLTRIRQRREEALDAEMRQFRVRDISTKAAILRLARDGIFSPTDRLKKAGKLSRPQRVSVLNGLADRLEAKHKHYQLAVLEEETVDRLYPQLHRLFWMVKQEYIVLMEVLHRIPSRGSVEVDISISDANLVAAFYDYFEKTLWKRIPPREKSRRHIVRWLRTLADGLESSGRDEQDTTERE